MDWFDVPYKLREFLKEKYYLFLSFIEGLEKAEQLVLKSKEIIKEMKNKNYKFTEQELEENMKIEEETNRHKMYLYKIMNDFSFKNREEFKEVLISIKNGEV